MAQRRFRASVSDGENVLNFRRHSPVERGAAALDLVHQAADVFQEMEQHARHTEARAQSLCNSAKEKLRHASRALEEARSRLEARENQLTAMEFRAQAAEAEAGETKRALALVEEAIRRRLLCTSPKADTGLTAVA